MFGVASCCCNEPEVWSERVVFLEAVPRKVNHDLYVYIYSTSDVESSEHIEYIGTWYGFEEESKQLYSESDAYSIEYLYSLDASNIEDVQLYINKRTSSIHTMEAVSPLVEPLFASNLLDYYNTETGLMESYGYVYVLSFIMVRNTYPCGVCN